MDTRVSRFQFARAIFTFFQEYHTAPQLLKAVGFCGESSAYVALVNSPGGSCSCIADVGSSHIDEDAAIPSAASASPSRALLKLLANSVRLLLCSGYRPVHLMFSRKFHHRTSTKARHLLVSHDGMTCWKHSVCAANGILGERRARSRGATTTL